MSERIATEKRLAELQLHIRNHGIHPEEFTPQEIEQFGFHGTHQCAIGETLGPNYDQHFDDVEKWLRELGSEEPHSLQIVSLHLVREHGVGFLSSEWREFLYCHLSRLVAKGVLS